MRMCCALVTSIKNHKSKKAKLRKVAKNGRKKKKFKKKRPVIYVIVICDVTRRRSFFPVTNQKYCKARGQYE